MSNAATGKFTLEYLLTLLLNVGFLGQQQAESIKQSYQSTIAGTSKHQKSLLTAQADP
jgi:hypothetical protein